MPRQGEHSVRFQWRVFQRSVRFFGCVWDATSGRHAKCREGFRGLAEEGERKVRDSTTRRGRWLVRRWRGIRRRRREKQGGRRPGYGPCGHNAGFAARNCRKDGREGKTRRIGG